MKSEPDFYSLPSDEQNAEEHLCDAPSRALGTLPFNSAQGGTDQRVLCGEQRRVERGRDRSTALTALLAEAKGDKN